MSKYILSILALLFAYSIVLADEKEQTEPIKIEPKVLANIYPKETTVALPPDAIARFGRGSGSQVAVSPDGSLTAVSSSVGVWLYSAYTDEFLALLTSERERIPSTVTFSPDSTQVAIGYRDGSVTLWNVFIENVEADLPIFLHSGAVTSVKFSPNGKLLAVGSSDNSATLWEVANKAIRFTFKHEDAVRAVLFSPEGGRLATAGMDATTKLWDVETGKQLRSFRHPDYRKSVTFPSGYTTSYNEGGIRCIAFSPDGKLLATGGINQDRDIKLWGIALEELRWSVTEEESAKSIAFSPDGTLVAAYFSDDVVYVFRVENGAPIVLTPDTKTWVRKNARKPPTQHTSESGYIKFSPDGKYLISLGRDRTIRIRDIETGAHVETLTSAGGYTKTIALSSEGDAIGISIMPDKAVKLWDAETTTLFPHETRVMAAEVSDDETLLATGGKDKNVRLWNLKTGELQQTLSGYHVGPISVLSFSPDGTLLVSGGSRNWEEQEGQEGITYTLFSADSVEDRTAQVWDVATGENITTFKHLGQVKAIAFSRDGTLLATSAGRTDIRSTKTWQDIVTLSTVNVTCLAFSPEGTRIAVGMSGRQPTVQIWDIAMGKPIATFIGHKRGIQSLAFSPDSSLLASGGSDGVIYLWDITSYR
ncbi:PD40 domain-containing protein [Candidatus Poribacteria bacterium]|nr:PD40 domain-containing protein [Candidatus Poribacteria bacterium]